jgi:hypothetical protein
MPNPRYNLVHAYGRLQYDVRCAVNIFVNNVGLLDTQHNAVMGFLEMLNQVGRL